MLSNFFRTYILDVTNNLQRNKMSLMSISTMKHEQPGYISPAARSCFIDWNAERGT